MISRTHVSFFSSFAPFSAPRYGTMVGHVVHQKVHGQKEGQLAIPFEYPTSKDSSAP
jgi:hypothetical protein